MTAKYMDWMTGKHYSSTEINVNNVLFDVYQLIMLTLSNNIQTVDIISIFKEGGGESFNRKCWSNSADMQDLFSPQQVINDAGESEKFKKHYMRIMKAELQYPILVRKKASGELQLLDGMHRVCNAVQQGLDKLPAILVTDSDILQCVVVSK